MSKENKKTTNEGEKHINSIQFELKYVLRIITGLAVGGLLIPFATQAIIPLFKPEVNIHGIEMWNQYVSLIVGIVATILSIVSVVLCYRSAMDGAQNTARLLDTSQKVGDLWNLNRVSISESRVIRDSSVKDDEV